MGNYLLYEDENQRIEIDERFHSIMKKFQIEEFKLEPYQQRCVLTETFAALSEMGIKTKEPIIISNIPIISAAAPLRLQPPHDKFNEAIELIETFNMDRENLEENNERLKVFQPIIYGQIFEKVIYDVRGFLLLREENNDVILLFGFKDTSNDMDFLDLLF